MSYRHIVIATDGSHAGTRALERALALARIGPAWVTVLGVAEPMPIFARQAEGERQNDLLRQVVDAAVAAAREAGVRARGLVLYGYPAEVVVDYGARHGAELIVVGAETGALGRTADKIVDLATCAVLVARE